MNAVSAWDPVSHSFIAEIDKYGNVLHTYSWGNDGFIGHWHKDAPEDIYAAHMAYQKGLASWVGSQELSSSYQKAYSYLSKMGGSPNFIILNNCKQHAFVLGVTAEAMHKMK